jgi:hypothetical protein
LVGEVVDDCVEGGSSGGVAWLVVFFRLGFVSQCSAVVDNCVECGPSNGVAWPVIIDDVILS